MKKTSDDELATMIAGLLLIAIAGYATSILYNFALYLNPYSVWYREGLVCLLIGFKLIR